MKAFKGVLFFVILITLFSLMLVSCGKEVPISKQNNNYSGCYEIPGLKEESPFYPVSSAVDEKGDIYILDQVSIKGSIFVFDKNYNFLKRFAPLDSNEKDYVDIAVDKYGIVYVADIGRGEIIKYQNEKEVKTFKPEENFFPRSIAVNSKGELVVLSYDKVYIFDSEGNVLKKFGESGSKKGQFKTMGSEFYIGPLGIAVDDEDNIYVADTLNKRLQKFSPAGTFLKDYPLEDEPQDVAVNEEGIFALLSDKIIKIDFNSEKKTEYYKLSDLYKGEYFGYSSIYGKKGILVACFSYLNKIVFFEKGKPIKIIDEKDTKENFVFPHHVYADNEYIIVISENFYEDTGKVQVFKKDGAFLFNLSLPNKDFMMPKDAVVSKGKIFVLDLDKVHIFDTEGNYIKSFGTRGGGTGEFGVFDNYGELLGPQDIAVGEDDNLYIADTFNDRINVYDNNGTFIKQIEIETPKEIAFDEKGNVYILKFDSPSVVKWESGGFKELLNEEAKGLFSTDERNPEDSGIQGIAVKGSLVFLSNTANHRIEVFNLRGDHIKSIGGYGFGKGQFNTPKGICFDDEGNLYIADSRNHRIVILKKGRI